jgi:hypothetical protein
LLYTEPLNMKFFPQPPGSSLVVLRF